MNIINDNNEKITDIYEASIAYEYKSASYIDRFF